ncbi:MAG: type II toxin-antitoxin system RelE/ParE family toxin [Ignavibacteriae bacterium]|nr:addiction module toxin RelE [Ignavibacteriota bacterium]NOG96812.1 type II toxin-antitoxin system RelE/ParE family toxin [Ignavibacteriota bacterium]
MLITIVELPEFQKRSSKIFTNDGADDLKYFLLKNPKAGDLIKHTGGIRKLRWTAKGKGKSGGARVIYFFHHKNTPLFLLTLFTKNEKIDLSNSERSELAKLTRILKIIITDKL